MNKISKEIYVTQKRLEVYIDVTCGTDLVPIALNVIDYEIPAETTATVYSIGKENKLKKQICTISENEISFTPQKGFFEVGSNLLQVRLTYQNKDLISFKIMVIGHESIVSDDAEEVKNNQGLMQQLLSEMGVLSARLNEALKIPEGGTTADAALNDIKVGYDGTVHDSPGDAVREQSKKAIEYAKETNLTLQQSKATSIISTLKGEVLSTHSSAAIPPRNLKLFGKSWQDGEPSIDNPQEIQSLGSGGSIGGKLIGENLIDVAGIYVSLWGVYQENGTRITVDGDKVIIEVLKQSNDIIIPLLKPTHSFHCSLTYTFSDGVEANTRPFSFRTNDNNVHGDAQISGTVIQFGSTEDNPIYRIGIGVGSSGGYFEVGTTITLTRSYVNETGNGFTPYIIAQPFTVQTPNGLLGIPVSSGGNYIDSNGQQYIADYVDFERGKYVQRVWKGKLTNLKLLRISKLDDGRYFFADPARDLMKNPPIAKGTNPCITNWYQYNAWAGVDMSIHIADTVMFIRDTTKTLDEMNALDWSGFEYEVILADPIETDLTAEEIAQYQALCMNYPNTTIINDAGAYMEVEYVEDTELYLVGNYVPISEHNALESRVSALEQMALN